MIDFLRDHWKYFIGAVCVHLLIAGVVALTVMSTSHRAPVPTLAIEAVVVDRSVLKAPARRERERREAAERARLEEQRRREEAQRQREEEERQQQAAEQRAQREAEEARQAEAQRVAEQRKREEAERARQAEAEKQRAEAERLKREQAERERLAEIKRRQQEAEERRRAEAERRAQELREKELQRQLAEEEARMAAANAGLLNQYIALLQQHVARNWNRPPSARPGIECTVKVNQAPGGTVLSVQIGACNGDAAVRQSIETAVHRASPLPAPPDPRLFERTLIFTFKPDE